MSYAPNILILLAFNPIFTSYASSSDSSSSSAMPNFAMQAPGPLMVIKWVQAFNASQGFNTPKQRRGNGQNVSGQPQF